MGLKETVRGVGRDLVTYWQTLVLIGTPLFLSPLPICINTSAARCGYVVLWMAVYWMTEVVPLAITAFLPLFLFPVFGVLQAKAVAINYLTDSNFVFVGSMMMALAVEESGLHERIALRILLSMGSNPRWLMLGFQLATAFLSMWMSNTATTAMMVPIAVAVIGELGEFGLGERRDSSVETGGDGESIQIGDKEKKKSEHKGPMDVEALQKLPLRERKVFKALLLSICYSANIGGTGTLTGTGSNIVLSGQLTKLYPEQDAVSFASWMAFAVPPMLLCLFLSWIWLQLFFIGFRKTSSNKRISGILRQKYNQLGRMRFNEGVTLFMFVLLVFLWLFRDPKVFPGWGSLFKKGYVTDGATAMFIGCCLFVIPRDVPDFCYFRSRNRTQKPQSRTTLLTWDSMQKKFSWSIVMLLGGGYAMAAGVKESGLSDWLGASLSSLNIWPVSLFVFASVVMITFATEFSSNVAAASIFIPMMNAVAQHIGVNPLLFILPITVGCSFAFMLPVATPPNAIVFSAKLLRVIDMAMAGFVMNWLCIAVTMLNVETYAHWLFGLGDVPEWAEATTQVSNTTEPITTQQLLL